MKTSTNAQKGDRFGLLMILCAAMLWGTVGVFVQTIYAQAETNSLSIGFFRLMFSVPVLLLAGLRILGWRMLQISQRDLLLMLFAGSLTAFYQVCYFAAIAHIGVATATLVTLCTLPVWVAILSWLLLHEQLTLKIGWAALLAIGGTALLVGVSSGDSEQSRRAGILLALCSALGYAVVTLCSRSLSKRCHPLQSLTVAFLAGTLVLLPIAWANGLTFHFSVLNWLALAYLGIVTTAVAYLLYFSGMRHTPAIVASIATLLEPLTATVLAWWLLGEHLSFAGAVGGLLLLMAIGLLLRD